MKIPIEYIPNLNGEQKRLLDALCWAHQEAAKANRNVSTVTMMNAMMGSGRIENGIAAAILTLGHIHAPLLQARGLYENGEREVVQLMINRGQKIAGFGNSFYKTSIDPAFNNVMELIGISFPRIMERLNELSGWMAEAGKPLYPNAALITAAVCSELKIRGGTETSLFILWRLPVWVDEMTRGWDETSEPKSPILT
jgi:citrate synthase